jgi:hypothetical protein
MKLRLLLLLVLLAALWALAAAEPASGQAPDLPATMAVERQTATAVYMYWRQDYRMLRACMTEAARAESLLTATAPPEIAAAPTPTPFDGRLGCVAP